MKSGSIHQFSIRVYAEDVDFMGIVYHANYLRFFERARTEMLRDNNLLLSSLVKEHILFAINEVNIKYLFPAKLDDLLTITTQITEVRACSLIFEQSIDSQDQKLISNAQIQVVCVNGNLKPRRLPDLIRIR